MIEYLGLVISLGTIMMDPMKVAGVTDWLIPKLKKEVQTFLGFMNFYTGSSKGFCILLDPYSTSRRKMLHGIGELNSRLCSTN
jgi:hypothetical protein